MAFAISGFLVTASLIKRGVLDYSLSRILRIFPALIICILVSTFIIGPLFTDLSLQDYLSHGKTYEYLKNATLIYKTQWYLPQVFSSNISQATNGSLWTLPVEGRCYLILATVSLFAIFKKKLISNLFIVAPFIFAYFYFDMLPLISNNPKWTRPAMFF